ALEKGDPDFRRHVHRGHVDRLGNIHHRRIGRHAFDRCLVWIDRNRFVAFLPVRAEGSVAELASIARGTDDRDGLHQPPITPPAAQYKRPTYNATACGARFSHFFFCRSSHFFSASAGRRSPIPTKRSTRKPRAKWSRGTTGSRRTSTTRIAGRN